LGPTFGFLKEFRGASLGIRALAITLFAKSVIQWHLRGIISQWKRLGGRTHPNVSLETNMEEQKEYEE